jgi:hypothetical protein
MFRKVSRHLSESRELYVNDGSVGSHRAVEANVRAVTNDPVASLYLTYALRREREKEEEGKVVVLVKNWRVKKETNDEQRKK